MSRESATNNEETRSIFVQEANEILQRMEDLLLEFIEGGESVDPQALLQETFRGFHTLKGSAAPSGFAHLGRIAHAIESHLERVRSGDAVFDVRLAEFLLVAKDRIATLMRYSDEEYARSPEAQSIEERFLGAMKESGLLDGAACADVSDAHAVPSVSSAMDRSSRKTWKIRMEPVRELFRFGLDPFPLIRYARERGTIGAMNVHPERIPLDDSGESFQPDLCYLMPEFEFTTADDERTIREYLSCYHDAIVVSIDPVLPPSALPVGSVPAEKAPADFPFDREADRRDERRERIERTAATVRVEAARLDHVIRLVGELIVAGVQVSQVAAKDGNRSLMESLDLLFRSISDVRESTMRLRMVPVGESFRRMKRIVHDLARDSGKKVVLHLSGEDSELDRTVTEKLIDPLVHILRNAMDHGIELPEERRQAGKSEAGSIWIRAQHYAGEILIEVQDDGRGVSRDAVRRKAVQLGLLAADAPADEDVLKYIFEPGFSTAKEVTSLSGRGVGMDVVRKNIEALRGAVELRSEEGQGTRIRIRLPLTLATIEGLHVVAGGVDCVITLDQVMECFECNDNLQESGLIRMRDEVIPGIDLARRFGFSQSSEDVERRFAIVVAHGGKKAGLVVDRLVGQMHSVVRPLRGHLENGKTYSGFTLLGDGSVAMILNVAGLIAEAGQGDHNGLPAESLGNRYAESAGVRQDALP